MTEYDTGGDYTRVFLDEVLVEARIGFAPWENFPDKKVPLLVSVELFTSQADWPDRKLENLIDYVRVYNEIMDWPNRPHRQSLEEVCQDLLAFCFEDAKVEACRVRLKKPHVVANSKGLGVELFRRRRADEK